MTKFAMLSAAALIGVGAFASSAAEARGGGALAAGIIGGLAAGALLGAAVSEAHAAPAYGYGPPSPAYGYDPAPVAFYRPAPVGRYDDDAEVYEARRVVSYEQGPTGYGYAPFRHRWNGDCERRYGCRGW